MTRTTADTTASANAASWFECPRLRSVAHRSADAMRRHIGPSVDQVPGGIVAVGDGRSPPVFVSVGSIDREQTAPVSRDTIYRLFCMTKAVTGLAVARMVESGRLSLDDELARFLPQFADLQVMTPDGLVPAARRVTIRDLLSHTGGFTMPLINSGPLAAMYQQRGLLAARIEAPALRRGTVDLPTSRADYLERLASMPLACQPGERYVYGLSYDLLGFVLEEVSGQRIDEHLTRAVLDPLGMDDTSFVVPREDLPRLAVSYFKGADGLERTERPGDSMYAYEPTYFDAGNGLASTARDYARLLDAILQPSRGARGGIPQAALAAMTRDMLPSSMHIGDEQAGAGKGIGGSVERRDGTPGPKRGTYGWAGFGGTSFWVDVESGLWTLVIMQYGPSKVLPVKRDVIAAQYC